MEEEPARLNITARSRHTGKQAGREAGTQVSKHAGKRHAEKQASKQAKCKRKSDSAIPSRIPDVLVKCIVHVRRKKMVRSVTPLQRNEERERESNN